MVFRLVTHTMLVFNPEKLTGHLFPFFPLKFYVKATVDGGDKGKSRLQDILLQYGNDAFLAPRARWKMFFSSCDNIKILFFFLFPPLCISIKLKLSPPPLRQRK